MAPRFGVWATRWTKIPFTEIRKPGDEEPRFGERRGHQKFCPEHVRSGSPIHGIDEQRYQMDR